jgi:hypothetical protein
MSAIFKPLRTIGRSTLGALLAVGFASRNRA